MIGNNRMDQHTMLRLDWRTNGKHYKKFEVMQTKQMS
jgi:hypothetical protein